MHWRAFAAAPHRLFFATGLGFLLLLSGWWLGVLIVRRYFGAALEPVIPGVIAHGAIMLYVLFTPFMFAFLLTVFPRWQPAPEIPRANQAAAFALLHTGLPVLLAGLYLSELVFASGWLMLCGAVLLIFFGLAKTWLKASERAVHAHVVLLAFLAALAGMLAFAAVVFFDRLDVWPQLAATGVWAFLLPVYFAVCHRMIPFFTSRVISGYVIWRPNAVLWLFVAAVFARAGFDSLIAWRWLPVLLAAVIAVMCAWRWRPRVRHGVALLAVLHISFAWLAAGLFMYALQDVVFAFTGELVLGRAPLHALGFGFFGGMLIAMMTRVSLGHSGRGHPGRPLELDRAGWRIFLLIQFAAVLRVIGELAGAMSLPVLLAGLAWFAAFVFWTRQYAKILFQPRVDGKPG